MGRIELKSLEVGQRVWICDYRFDDYDNKPIRHVEPQLVEVRPKSEAPKKIYYSNIYFAKLSKKTGAILKQGHAPFDNTGYRSYTGVMLNIFDNEKECKEHYCNEKLIVTQAVVNYLQAKVKGYTQQIGELFVEMEQLSIDLVELK